MPPRRWPRWCVTQRPSIPTPGAGTANPPQRRRLGTAVHVDGRIEQTAPGRFGLGDEVARCLHGLPPDWRLAGLLSLAFAEDFAVVDGRDATLPWLAVALPSHWAPEEKVGRHFGEIHAPVADGEWLRGDGERADAAGHRRRALGAFRLERHRPAAAARPPGARRRTALAAHRRWPTPGGAPNARPSFRCRKSTQAVFTIHVEVQRLAEAIDYTGTRRGAARRRGVDERRRCSTIAA